MRAIALARLYPKDEMGRGKKSTLSVDFARTYLNRARKVLAVAPELADAVMDGGGLAQALLPAPIVTGSRRSKSSCPAARHGLRNPSVRRAAERPARD